VALLSSLLNQLPPQLIQLPGAAATGTHTNELGGTIVIYLPLLLAVMVGWRPVRNRPFLIILLLGVAFSAVVILLLSQSRTAWIGALGGTAVLLLSWFLFLPKSRLKRMGQITAVILAVLFLVVLSQLDWNQVVTFWEEPPRNTAVGTFTTLNYRRQLWGAALEVLDDAPFTGTGLGAFRRVVPRLYPISASDVKDVAHAHNMLLQVAVDTGLPGLVAYLAILLIVAVTTYQIARQAGQDKLLILGLFACLAGLHLFGLTDALAPGAKPGLLFWMALGLITALPQLKD
jgi:putative inorganic carbon (HCO3(-)) transporter